MKIAVTYENENIFQHFGHTEHFKIYNISNGSITDSKIVNSAGRGHEALAGFLFGLNVDAVICGEIGAGAQNALAQAGIKFYSGASGNADEAVKALLAGNLDCNSNIVCNHHSRIHGEGHGCGGNCHH